MRIAIKIVAAVLTGGCIVATTHPAAAGLRERFDIRINVDAEVFKVGEPVTGDVEIRNSSMAGIPITLSIKLYKDDELVHDITTGVGSLFPGRNTFSFADLGIPPLEHDPTAAGVWNWVIIKRTQDGSVAGKAQFRIEEGTWPPEEERRRKIQRFRRRQ